MTNILFEVYGDLPSYQLTIKSFNCLCQEFPIKVRAKFSRYIKRDDIAWCDILYIVRGDNPASMYLAKKAKSLGRKVILGLDDDLMEYVLEQQVYVEKKRKKCLRAVISASDVMVTTNKHLAEKYKSLYGIDCALSDTIVSSNDFDPEVDAEERVNVIYAANAGHKIFFDQIISPILMEFAHKYKGQLSLTAVGPDLNFDNLPVTTYKYSSMPFAEYQEFMSSHHFDIGLAPLFDNEVCQSKYFNKYLEYSSHNICGVYSNVAPYNYVVKDKVNGLLVNNDPREWFNALCALMDDKLLRLSCVNNAKRHILEKFSCKAVGDRLADQIPFLLSYKAPVPKKVRLRPMYLYFLFYEFQRRILNLFI